MAVVPVGDADMVQAVRQLASPADDAVVDADMAQAEPDPLEVAIRQVVLGHFRRQG